MLNDQQFDRLAPYEPYFKTALNSSYPRSPGRRALTEIHAVLRELDPLQPALNSTCGTCILRILKKAGRLYFDRKELDAKNDAEAVAATQEAVTAANATPEAAAGKSTLVPQPPAEAPKEAKSAAPKPKTGKAPAKPNKAKKPAPKPPKKK